MKEESFVSVVIPAYNQAQYLSGAIESVQAQSYNEYEIISKVANDIGMPQYMSIGIAVIRTIDCTLVKLII